MYHFCVRWEISGVFVLVQRVHIPTRSAEPMHASSMDHMIFVHCSFRRLLGEGGAGDPLHF
jgi:hypothetical protein